MTAARPLRDVFHELAGDAGAAGGAAVVRDPAEMLRDSGHSDLPDDLAAEAVVSYADTAPVEIAQHLAPFVQANSPVPMAPGNERGDEIEAAAWFDALATAPAADVEPAGIDPADIDLADRLDPADRLDLADRLDPADRLDSADRLDHAGGDDSAVPNDGADAHTAFGSGGAGAEFGFGRGDSGTGTDAPSWRDSGAHDQDTAVPETIDEPVGFDHIESIDSESAEEPAIEDATDPHADLDEA